MGPTPALACQVPPIHEVLGPTHLDIPLLTGFLSPPQGFEPVTKSLRSLGKHPCYQLSYSESAPHFNIGPCGRGFELSRRRKKRAIGTCPYSLVSEWSPPAGRPQGGALTGFLSPPQGFEPVTKSLRSLGKHPCYQLSYSSVGSRDASLRTLSSW